jgi:hypothetical protein
MPEVPEFSFGKGRNQIVLKGKAAIREGGWAIRFLLISRALAVLLSALAVVSAIFLFHLS